MITLAAFCGEAGEVHWDVFAKQEYDWGEDMKGTSAAYYGGNVSPEIGFKYNYNPAGNLILSITPAMEFMNCGNNGIYWVIANYGDQLCSSSDFLTKTLLVDFGFSGAKVGNDISISVGGKSFYAACFGTALEYDALTNQYHEDTYFAWVQINATLKGGISVGGSGVSIGDGIIVGQYATIPLDVPEPTPEPTSGMLLLLGTAALCLKRHFREVERL